MRTGCFLVGLLTAFHGTSLSAQAVQPAQHANLESATDAERRGDLDHARPILVELLAASPEDPDLLRRLANLEARAKNFDLALAYIDQAFRRAPDDLDIALARGFILYWRGDRQAARKVAASIASRDPSYPELDQLQKALSRPENGSGLRSISIFVGGGASDIVTFSGSRRTWFRQNLATAVKLSDSQTVALSVNREDRGVTDTRIGARVDRQFTLGGFYVAAAVTPDPDFRESWSLSAGGDLTLSKVVSLPFDLRVADYAEGRIVTAQPGLRVALGCCLSMTARAIHILGAENGYHLGGSTRADFNFNRGASFFIAAASYPDAERDNVRRLRSFAAGTNLAVNDRFGLRVAGLFENRKASYRQYGGDLTLTYRLAR